MCVSSVTEELQGTYLWYLMLTHTFSRKMIELDAHTPFRTAT